MTKVQMQYEPFDDIIRRVADLRERVDDYRRRGRFILDLMDAGAWVGRGSDAFTDELLNQVLPSLDRLSAALEAITVTLRAAMQQIQDAEQQGAALFKGGLATAAGVGALMGGLAALVAKAHPSWLTEYSEQDGGFTGAKEAEVLFINGIRTDSGSHISGLMQVSKAYGNVPVTGIYNKTDGVAVDLYQSVKDWAHARFGNGVSSNPAVESAKEWIRTHPNGQLVVHSQGAAITSAALMDLSREKPPFNLDNLKVMTLGGAGAKFPWGPEYRHLSFSGDLVPEATLAINNPTMLLNHARNPEYTSIPFSAGDPLKTHDMGLYLRNLDNFERAEQIEDAVFRSAPPSTNFLESIGRQWGYNQLMNEIQVNI